MDPIFDRENKLAGWIEGDNIYDTHGQPIAFLINENVLTTVPSILALYKEVFAGISKVT